ncbi:mitochondrial cytochrome b2 [Reticulomyxa filosa]|uniref:L-lactate dehydrogenase (cytochrome) n=1 Tax=Reticulomyxa filosa TaxID=46433 RepID=X6NX61_RETFI|nr:mitochondrial cytochrome b2 [Reticulomyxa filosa]|eukprot:ETO30601.1 mitochondrial cytochrome b2 [Reticulomyxa filosa]
MSRELKYYTLEEVSRHNKATDCWLILYDKVYDVTSFVNDHPGGVNLIVDNSGKDATEVFESVGHTKALLTTILAADACIGHLHPDDRRKPSTPQSAAKSAASVRTAEEDKSPAKVLEVGTTEETVPELDKFINVYDFEKYAPLKMTKQGLAYYSSGKGVIFFKIVNQNIKIKVDVTTVDMRTKILGFESSCPIYLSATALGKLAHDDGELAIARAAYNSGVIQMIPTLGSYSLEEICNARVDKTSQVQFFQLYVNANRELTRKLVKTAEAHGCKALFITVDAPQLARRERDMRFKVNTNPANVQSNQSSSNGSTQQGFSKALSSFIDPSLQWKDIAWFQSITNMKIVLKGIQCAEDALLAVKHGVDGIVLSNHGGRQLDTSRSSIEVLVEVMDALKRARVDDRIEVYVDGGIRRGTDIFKALALGAKAVGIGRPMLWGLACHGQPGVQKVIDLLKAELESTMRLMGTPTLAAIRKDMLVVDDISHHVTFVPTNELASQVYTPLKPLTSKM